MELGIVVGDVLVLPLEREAAIWSLRRVQPISACGTLEICITGRRPAVTMRGSVATLSALQTSAVTVSL
ncbi:hypothetical protein [Streptomyces goshikiensis]|uniref:hypothetical protein n=1 Tax=Streptomyces goshikiensis TaxID=1942 RepID=UPI0036CAFDB2